MSESWDEYADTWDTNSEVIKYSEKAFDCISELIDLEGRDVLDFGCGTGLLTEKISNLASSVVAIDSSKKMIDILTEKKLENVNPFVCEITQESVKTIAAFHSKFDLIVASSVCAFLEDYDSTLIHLKSLLRPEGLFVQWDWKRVESDSEFGFTEDMIQQAYSNLDLKVIEIKSVFSIISEKGSMDVIMGMGKNA
ncbi:MAG: methyltransferase domain-containing protein [SAR324 cluster bacterium]|nr:methyltransferase domain-containing protein [SAR324 cluster bacterium]